VLVAAVADEIDRLAGRIEQLGVQLARLVRDGGDDAHPAWAARDAVLAAGRLTAAAEVVGSVAFVQAEVTNCSAEDGFRDTARWARHHTGVSASSTSLWRRVAACLDRYPVLGQAFLEGRIHAHHLAAIDRVIPARFGFEQRHAAQGMLDDLQGELVDIARQSTQREFERFCDRLRDRIDADGPQPADGDGQSEIHLRRLPSGRWTLYGDLTASDGALLATLLAERVSQQTRARRHEQQQASAEPTDTESGEDGETDTDAPKPDHAVRLGDALRSLLLDGAGAKRPGRVGLFLHMDLDDLAVRGANVSARTEANLDISDDTLWGLLAGADVTPIITNSGTPLSYGRTRRLAPDILRRALAERDRSCWFPGCDRPPHMHQIHHPDEWDHGGCTGPDNCIGGCVEHHHLVHDHGWHVTLPDDGGPGGVTITRPDGTTLDPTPQWQQRQRRHDPYRQRTLARLDQLRADRAG
jgi:hypothetical protein